MKKILLLSLFLFAYSFSHSQNLSFDELLNLRKQNIAQLEEYLTSKGWSFLSADEPTYTTLGKATFAYKISQFDNRAESFISYLYSEYSGAKRLSIQVVKKETYNTYLARIKALGLKLIKSEIKNGSIEKTYRGATTTVKISIGSSEDDIYSNSTAYHFFILENNDFIENFEVDIYDSPIIDSTVTPMAMPRY